MKNTMKRLLPLLLIFAATLHAQQVPPAPSFEAATIKPAADSGPAAMGVHIAGRNFTTDSTSLAQLMSFAYGVHIKQVFGPDWVTKQKFAVTAVHDGDAPPTEDQWKTMIGQLIVDRFQLKFHHDKRELPVFALTVAKPGETKLTPTTHPGPLPRFRFNFTPQPTAGMLMTVTNSSMWDLSEAMQVGVMDRPVADQTNLTGRFDFTLLWMPDDSQFDGRMRNIPHMDNAASALFTAMPEQLGLRLDAVKAPVDVIIIDSVTQPTPN